MLSMLSIGAAQAQDSPTLREILDLAKERNPAVAAARAQWQAANSLILPSKTWPDPKVGFEYFGVSRSRLDLAQADERWFGVGQEIPFPGKLSLHGKAAYHEAERAKNRFSGVELDVFAQVKTAYFDLMLAQRSQEIFEESVQVLGQFAKIAESKYSAGRVSQGDVLRAQVELSRMFNQVITTSQEKEIHQARLNALIAEPPEKSFQVQEEPDPEPLGLRYDNLVYLAFANRPEIQEASHHVEHAQAELATAKADYLPDFELGYSWRTMEGRPGDSIAMFKFNLPLWFWRQASQVKSKAAEKEHADFSLKQMEIESQYEVKEFLIQAESALRSLELFKTTILPQAEQALKVIQANYQSGQATFLELLDSWRALLDFRLEYFQHLANYAKSLAHLERLVGINLLKVKKAGG